jgi:hypothetical protein
VLERSEVVFAVGVLAEVAEGLDRFVEAELAERPGDDGVAGTGREDDAAKLRPHARAERVVERGDLGRALGVDCQEHLRRAGDIRGSGAAVRDGGLRKW